MAALVLFPSRVRFVNDDGTLTPEAYRALQEIVDRTGGTLGDSGVDTFSVDTYGDLSNSSLNVAYTDVVQSQSQQSIADLLTQPFTQVEQLQEMVIQPQGNDLYIDVPQATTALAPAYKPGRMYFDTTLNKLRIGGAAAYETITSV